MNDKFPINEIILNGRGFAVMTFLDAYNSECSIQESSLVTPHIWLGVDFGSEGQKVGYVEPVSGETIGGRMHLNRQQAYSIGMMLVEFAFTGEFPLETYKYPKSLENENA